ncbi:MAG TPA: hypothetical protein VMV69_14040 [Pirellulales bacterium]|nr:hypothetical protein [Pirellulales bacterium]
MRVLISWLGMSDFMAVRSTKPDDVGPLCRLLRRERFDRLYLLNDLDEAQCERRELPKFADYLSWLGREVGEGNLPQIDPPREVKTFPCPLAPSRPKRCNDR